MIAALWFGVINKKMHFILTLALLLLIINTALFADSETKNHWLEAVKARDTAKIAQLLQTTQNINQQTKKGLTALMATAAQGDHRIARKLLLKNAEPNIVNNRGGSALMYGAALNHLKTIVLLIEYGAKINSRAENGWTALTLAAAKGNDKIVAELLANGANPNIPDVYGWTALMRAIEHDRNNTVSLIIQHRLTQISRINNKGQSALHLAALRNQCDTVENLIDAGADTQLLDFKDKTPLQGSHCSLNLKE